MNKKITDYQMDKMAFVYSTEFDRLLVFPLDNIIYALNMWDVIINALQKKMSFKAVISLCNSLPDLKEFCHEEGEVENDKFFFPDDYFDWSVGSPFNENCIMSDLPAQINIIIDEISTATGGEELIINLDKEDELLEICKENKWGIVKDNSLIDDVLSAGYDAITSQWKSSPSQSQDKQHIKEPLPHPEVQKTLLQMKESGMLDPEVVEMVKKEMLHEKMVQSAVKRNPKLTHKEASEMLEALGF